MSNFSTNLQFNLAQLNSLAKEQEKIRKNVQIQQEKIAQRVEQNRDNLHSTVSATQEQEDSYKINPDEENSKNSEQEKNIKRPLVLKLKKHNQTSEIFKDDKKGNNIDFSC